ncbi:MAG: hypothetical protein JSU86_18350 [Phycisphaerales bacterium]|nr:MAG: hypothetical protein JSU86_18350 [Phycisphaerales bacterium]
MQERCIRQIEAAFAMAVVGFAAGCEGPPKAEQPLVLFPSPPAKPRIQFLTWASGAAQVEPPRDALDAFLLGEEPTLQKVIQKPYGVAARDGVVYVCDTKGLCVCKLDFKKQTYSVFGDRGPGRLRKPINIAIDALGYKFVADPVRKQIVVFDPDDRYSAAFDIPKPCRPVDVAVFQNELYVLDNDESCQIVVLDRTSGEVLRTFGGPGGEPGQFKIPNSLSVGPEGHLYICDTHNWRIQKLTREGEPVWVRGTPGYRYGRFGRPRGLRVGPDGVIYVVDGATEIVQMFNSEGQTLMHFGGPGKVPGTLVLPSTLAVDKTSVPYFKEHVHEAFDVEYLLFVASQYGKHLVSVYAFGSFPEGFQLIDSEIATLPQVSPDQGIPPVDPGRAPTADEGGEGDKPAETPKANQQD